LIDFDAESVKFEAEEKSKYVGKSSSFVSVAADQFDAIKNRDVRSLACHEVVALIRNDSGIVALAKNENGGEPVWTREHEEVFISHKIDGQVFVTITESEYANMIFQKLRPSYTPEIHTKLFETLVKLGKDITNHDFKYSESRRESFSGSRSSIENSKYPKLSDKEKIGIIIGKIRHSSKRGQSMSDDDLAEHARNLCDVEELKKAYLNREFKAIKKLFSSMRVQKNNMVTGAFMSNSGAEDSKNLITVLTEEDLLSKIPQDIDEAEEMSKKLAAQFKETIKVKLVIAEIAKTKKEKTLRRLLSPIISSVSMAPQFGMFHSGLIVG